MLDNTLVIRPPTTARWASPTAACGRRTSTSTRSPCACRWSTPTRAVPDARRPTHALVSHVDFLPTLASLVGAPAAARAAWQGVDYSEQILSPRAEAAAGLHRLHLRRLPVRPGQRALLRSRRNHIVSIRETALEDRPLLRRRRQGPRPVGDVRPQDRPARAHEPRLRGPQAHGRAGARSTSACSASSPRSRRRGCSRSPDPRRRRRPTTRAERARAAVRGTSERRSDRHWGPESVRRRSSRP